MISKNTKLIKRIARQMGATVKVTLKERNLFELAYKGKKITVERSFFINRSPYVGVQTTKFKDATYKILIDAKISTPKAVFFYDCKPSNAQIEKKLKKLKYPIIIKQLEGSNSKDLYPNVQTVPAAVKKVKTELAKNCRLMAQQMVFGNEYRLLVLDDKVIGALQMCPPAVYGDGVSTIEQLIREANKYLKKPVAIDEDLKNVLKEQKYSIKSVPAKGERVRVKFYSSLASGGETVDATADVHKGFHKIGFEIAKACGKYLCGIDIICEDISKNPKNQKYFILEVNGRPDLTIHYSPDHGKTTDVVGEIIQFIAKSKIVFN